MEYFKKPSFKLLENKEQLIAASKDEKNLKYFSGTEKYNHNNFINENINSLKTDYNEKLKIVKITDYINNILDKDDSTISRIFFDIKKEPKYIEVFKNEKFELLGISKNISFLHSFSNEYDEYYDPEKIIGFRYYENGPYKNGNYFTIIKRNNYKYFILEKDNSENPMKDINNISFYDEELNCYKIIRKIIFEKQKIKLIGYNGDLFPEILGYCLALESQGIINKFKCIEPLIPNLKSKSIISESYPKDINKDLIYIEPFIYDGHISTIITSYKDKERYNIILDISHHHFDREKANFSFLPKLFKNTINNKIYPNKNFQAYSSCCIWFYGIIEYLINNKKYSNFDEINTILSKNDFEFYIDVINYLSKEIQGIDCLIKQEDNFIQTKEEAKNIDFNRFTFYCIKDKKYYSIHKNIIYNKFLDIDKFIFGNFLYYNKMELFEKTQNYISLIYELKNNLELNLKYYDMLPKDENIELGKNDIRDSLENIDKSIALFEKEYDYGFYYKNMLFYGNWINSILEEIVIPFPFNKFQQSKIYSFDFSDFIKEALIIYSQIKKDVEKKTTIFSVQTILNEINSSNDICFSVMNK